MSENDPGQTGQQDNEGQQQKGGGFDASPWQAFAEETGLSPEQVRKRLDHSRTWEQRAKENKTAADTAQTLEQQVTELREAMAQRDLADMERNSKLALTQVRAELANRGVNADDVKELLAEIDPAQRLLADGDVDDKAVKRLAESLARVAGRPAPDPDQGRKGGAAPADMNQLIRRAAGVGQR